VQASNAALGAQDRHEPAEEHQLLRRGEAAFVAPVVATNDTVGNLR